MTLIPREFPASQHKKKRKATSASSDGGARKRGSASHNLHPNAASAPAATAPAAKERSVDDLLSGMLGDSASNVLQGLDVGDVDFLSTPRSTPPPAGTSHQLQAKRSRGNKKQKGDELASSHF